MKKLHLKKIIAEGGRKPKPFFWSEREEKIPWPIYFSFHK